jgi:hypothetical protein
VHVSGVCRCGPPLPLLAAPAPTFREGRGLDLAPAPFIFEIYEFFACFFACGRSYQLGFDAVSQVVVNNILL